MEHYAKNRIQLLCLFVFTSLIGCALPEQSVVDSNDYDRESEQHVLLKRLDAYNTECFSDLEITPYLETESRKLKKLELGRDYLPLIEGLFLNPGLRNRNLTILITGSVKDEFSERILSLLPNTFLNVEKASSIRYFGRTRVDTKSQVEMTSTFATAFGNDSCKSTVTGFDKRKLPMSWGKFLIGGINGIEPTIEQISVSCGNGRETFIGSSPIKSNGNLRSMDNVLAGVKVADTFKREDCQVSTYSSKGNYSGISGKCSFVKSKGEIQCSFSGASAQKI